MPKARLVLLAESCSAVRAAIGRMLLCEENSEQRAAAEEQYRRALRTLLRLSREEQYGLYLEVAGELAAKD